jgi:hypothetical protein
MLSTEPGWHLYFVDGDKIESAEWVLELALSFWTTFIYENEVAR